MKRLLAMTTVAMALTPVVATASPSPSPGLDSVLAAPPASTYVEAKSAAGGVLEGPFTAQEYAQQGGTAHPAQVQATLEHYGFVGGYGRTWVESANGHAIVEAVIAFTGGEGAKKWLTASEAADKADPNYLHSDAVDGINPYYGAHFADTSNSTYGDAFAFVKGNDYFGLVMVSARDDVLTLAQQQAKKQYSEAPDSTIPPSQWPENAPNVPAIVGGVVGFALVAALVVVGAFLVVRVRRRGTMPMMTAGAVAGMPLSGVQMSPDGGYWWDGQGWRDAALEAPPTAQRSTDGTLWWDGRTWRQVPGGSPQQQAEPPNWPSPPTG